MAAPEIKDFVRPTVIVRGVMRAHGKSTEMIFTNKYKMCRTVKCYVRPDKTHVELIGDIRTALVKAGVVDFNIKIKDSTTWRAANSLIVSIPFKEQL
jgi:hypothetical protein